MFGKWFLKIGAWIMERLLLHWLTKLGDYMAERAREARAKEIAQANLEAYKKAIEEKKSDEEISRLAENLLNNRKP